jgi:RNA polymerase sigma factor (sigma-70 family)
MQLIECASPAVEADTEQRVALREARHLLNGLLLDLTERQQQIIVWKYWRGATTDNIARALGIPTPVTRRLLADAVKELRRAMRRKMHIAVQGPGKVWHLLLPGNPSR